MASMYEIIQKKQRAEELNESEIKFFVENYTSEKVPDYQASALLMAIYFNGMSNIETALLTKYMVESGEVIDLSKIEGIKVDKHSTGGVGDKATLVTGPIAAALGEKVAKFSGRGLGHTGGTIDKLESIPGFNTELSIEEFINIVNDVGVAVAGATGDIAPADKKMYALRDVTATTNSMPLIASSIMSKKLASGADAIVLDVKCGSGAFMADEESATELANRMIDIGKHAGKKITALITNMNQVLGNYVGNALEVFESVQTLLGKGPADLVELCVEQCVQSLLLSTEETNTDSLKEKINNVINDGSAYNKFLEMVKAQGGDVEFVKNINRIFDDNVYTYKCVSKEKGYINSMQTEQIGIASVGLGAGRMVKTDIIDNNAGIRVMKKVGDKVDVGDELAIFYCSKNDDSAFKKVEELYLSSIEILPEFNEANKTDTIIKVIK